MKLLISKLAFFSLIFTVLTLYIFSPNLSPSPLIIETLAKQDLSSKEAIINHNDGGVILFDRNDRPFFSFFDSRRKTVVPFSQVSPFVPKALIAAEDKDFYSHHGFSIKAIIRSALDNFKAQKLAYGGSTITQQLVKNTLLTPDRNLLRKYEEIMLASRIERRYSKDDILEMYLNSVYFGEGAFGIEEAAQTYFGKKAQDLDLAEASLLVAVLPAPSHLSPFSGSMEDLKIRQKYVLQKMVEQNYISAEEKDKAESEELAFSNKIEEEKMQAPHFAFLVKDELIKRYGEQALASSGFKVKTSIDLDWQAYAEKVVADQVEKLAPNKVTNGAAVILDAQTGEILALVGSKNWDEEDFGKVDVVISPRQPGSAFKPLVYAAGLEERVITPTTILKDQPTTYGGKDGVPPYSPQNYDRKFRGQVLARRALANSLNVPSVEVLSKVGVEKAMEIAERLGVTTLTNPNQYGLSLVLGSGEVKLLELTGAYSVFANQGRKNSPTAILKITGKDGQSVYNYQPSNDQVLDEAVAFQITSILSDPQTRKEIFGNSLDNTVGAAVKTGTTESYRDSLTVGYTNKLAVGVWVGNNDSTPMDNVAGSLGAAPIWKSLIENFSDGKANFEPPEDVVGKYVCRYNGLLLNSEATSSGYLEYFLPGTEPTKACVLPTPTPATSPSNPPSPTP